MNEIYPMWVEAHGVPIVTPVNWYQVASPVKLMMDRLVCADGGNTDPTRTHGKDARQAKRIEFEGWGCPQHLAGRLFAVVAHDNTEGAEGVRRSLADWLRATGLVPAGPMAEVDRYIGYWQPSPTPPATTSSTATGRSRRKSATPPGPCSRPSRPLGPAGRSARAATYRNRARSDRQRHHWCAHGIVPPVDGRPYKDWTREPSAHLWPLEPSGGRPLGLKWGAAELEAAMTDGGGSKELDQAFEGLEAEAPDRVSRAVRWLRDPEARWIRIPLGVLFVLGGLLWFLPVLGI
jgi:hypothetical protein